MSDEILPVDDFFNDHQANEYLLVCPHCGQIRGIDRYASLEEFKGEQFQDNLCGGWWEISRNAIFSIKTVEQLHKLSDEFTPK